MISNFLLSPTFLCDYTFSCISIFVSVHLLWRSDLTDKMKRCFFQAVVVSILLYRCTTCVIFWPSTRPKMLSKVMHRKKVTHSNGSYERKSRGRKLADEMGRAKKFPWYSHRLMHRKRVTCELHDSYFRLIMLKHSISKIEWASNEYITQLSSSPSGSCGQLSCSRVGDWMEL